MSGSYKPKPKFYTASQDMVFAALEVKESFESWATGCEQLLGSNPKVLTVRVLVSRRYIEIGFEKGVTISQATAIINQFISQYDPEII